MKSYVSKILLLSCLASPAFASIDCLTSEINDVYLQHGYTHTVASHHKIYITNQLTTSASYGYTLQLCADEQGCEVRNKTITLAPGQVFRFHTQVKIDLRYGKPGDRNITASTYVYGSESGTIQKTAKVIVMG